MCLCSNNMVFSVISVIFICINNNVCNFKDKGRFGWVVL